MSNSKVTVIISSEDNKRQFQVKALLDTGNNIVNGVAISEHTHNRLGGSFLKLGGKNVKGASNKKLPVKGVSTPIKLKIDNKVFLVKPYVIKDLTDPVNIGRKFMEKANLELKYGVKNLLQVCNEKEIEMVRAIEENPSGRERCKTKGKGAVVRAKPVLPSPVMAAETSLLKPNSVHFIKVEKIKGEQIVEPIRDEQLQVRPAEYKEAEQIAILNTSECFRMIKKGEQVGESYPCDVGQAEEVKNPKKVQKESAEDSSTNEEVRKRSFCKLMEELKIEENVVLKETQL